MLLPGNQTGASSLAMLFISTWSRSLVFDGDVRFQNQYIRLYRLKPTDNPAFDWIFEPLPTGHVRNVMPIGPAITWAPLVLIVTFVVSGLRLAGVNYPLDGSWMPVPGNSRIQRNRGGHRRYLVRLPGRPAAVLRTHSHLVDTRHVARLKRALLLGDLAVVSHAPSMLATGLLTFWWIRTRDRSTAGATRNSADSPGLQRWCDGGRNLAASAGP